MVLVLEGITDNKNRALGEIRQILQKHNFKMANEGSIKWQFERRGIILVKQNSKTKEDLELLAIEAGAEDIQWYNEEGEDFLEIRTIPETMEAVKKAIEGQGVAIKSLSLGWVAKEEVNLPAPDREKIDKLFNDLDDSETVQNIYSNLKN